MTTLREQQLVSEIKEITKQIEELEEKREALFFELDEELKLKWQ